MARKSESNFRDRVRAFLRTLPHTLAFPIQQSSIQGTPDFLLNSFGRFVALELKSGEGSLTKLQKFMLTKVSLTNGVAIVAFPENWPQVKEQLTRLDRGETIP